MRECGPVRPCPACCAKDSMKPPAALHALIDDGVIDEVLRPLKSGKEAAVYVVRSGGEVRCAKVYKAIDRKRVVEGKSVSVRVDLGGRRIIKKKKRQQKT